MDIFAKLMRDNRLQQYDQSRSFTAWLYKVAANIAGYAAAAQDSSR